ncbi:hypothetical protein FC694_22530 [Bacillus wiedmannii]|uniref:Uncharacterized protein n=1 Tax=Bacillus wiedmannii TaxID=1890302 RepID=A0A4U2MMD5_9BACI|nr:hypothetical protein [Bacillus wiedmannii]TKH12194.1 hypothetical protein FC694_22530 [Bacillus wiedmannii]
MIVYTVLAYDYISLVTTDLDKALKEVQTDSIFLLQAWEDEREILEIRFYKKQQKYETKISHGINPNKKTLKKILNQIKTV